ncbi:MULTISPECIES: hypothetical protein [Bacillales]|jgi:lia operon protein LiaI|uniref:Conserved membrane protein n=1 Tax=Brevibacillus aydinogluensis TaxID=927786 RepID=A0AA48RIZ9_9BACL|nr:MULTISPECIES: hypothetical protein [Bacillales]REK66743.1 MAG: hypothetical protein DF221_02410 [Brevibacillus sp.]MBR8660029.1 hypothetical protein [Brevibacillus sp. NL20B1]MDT3418159.1 lia operon protein LiaI [Brevibacillus aydinogluensis]NNV02231.1 hypothetical protein [Brevibacillus sp. MCWH]UFJ62844.1 hypothetical protein IRT44_08930 [Anoxybacillus sediminis]
MSERSGKVLLGLILLLIGGLVILDQLGIDSSELLRVLIPGLIMLYGARKMMSSSGSRFTGGLILLIGFLMLIGKLHVLFHAVLAIGVMYLGFRLLRQRDVPDQTVPTVGERQWAQRVLQDDDVLDRWEKSVTRRQQP